MNTRFESEVPRIALLVEVSAKAEGLGKQAPRCDDQIFGCECASLSGIEANRGDKQFVGDTGSAANHSRPLATFRPNEVLQRICCGSLDLRDAVTPSQDPNSNVYRS